MKFDNKTIAFGLIALILLFWNKISALICPNVSCDCENIVYTPPKDENNEYDLDNEQPFFTPDFNPNTNINLEAYERQEDASPLHNNGIGRLIGYDETSDIATFK